MGVDTQKSFFFRALIERSLAICCFMFVRIDNFICKYWHGFHMFLLFWCAYDWNASETVANNTSLLLLLFLFIFVLIFATDELNNMEGPIAICRYVCVSTRGKMYVRNVCESVLIECTIKSAINAFYGHAKRPVLYTSYSMKVWTTKIYIWHASMWFVCIYVRSLLNFCDTNTHTAQCVC